MKSKIIKILTFEDILLMFYVTQFCVHFLELHICVCVWRYYVIIAVNSSVFPVCCRGSGKVLVIVWNVQGRIQEGVGELQSPVS